MKEQARKEEAPTAKNSIIFYEGYVGSFFLGQRM
jgi:hypothetical protein